MALSASKIVQRIPRGVTFPWLEGSSRVDKSSVVKRNAASVAGEKKQEKKTRLRPNGKRVEWTAGGRRARVRQRRLNSVNLWHAAKGTRTEIPCKYDSSPSPSSFLRATGVALFPLLVAKPSSADGREKGEKRRLSRVDEWRVRRGSAGSRGPGWARLSRASKTEKKEPARRKRRCEREKSAKLSRRKVEWKARGRAGEGGGRRGQKPSILFMNMYGSLEQAREADYGLLLRTVEHAEALAAPRARCPNLESK